MNHLARRTFLSLPLVAAYAKAAKIPVLIIDGVNNHDWQAATEGIREILESTGHFHVDVSTTPPAKEPAEAWSNWHPEFSHYKVVVNNFNGGHTETGLRWPSKVEWALHNYVRNGGGLVNYHAANNAFLQWDDYSEMIGLGWRNKSFGPALILDEKEAVVVVPAGEGMNPGHGPRHAFQVTTRDTGHAITKGLPKHWMHPAEQLTHGQHAVSNPRFGQIEKELLILTYALSEVSKNREPMDWVRSWGNGRIYTTMLGHTWRDEKNPNLANPVFRKLFAHGVEWAATGHVAEKGNLLA